MGKFGGFMAKQKRAERDLNKNLRKMAKAAKRAKWQDRKIKRRAQPKRKLKNYGLEE